MTEKTKPKRLPKLTDAERHKRFLETAREVGASEDPKDFDRAFDNVISHPPSSAKVPKERQKGPTAKI